MLYVGPQTLPLGSILGFDALLRLEMIPKAPCEDLEIVVGLAEPIYQFVNNFQLL